VKLWKLPTGAPLVPMQHHLRVVSHPGACREREEIFGPVLVVITYDTEEEAIRIANDSL